MTFLNPAGLWILLGVPVLIIVYLLRRQHEDRAVASTYIWKLSDRFLKKRFPLRLHGIILLLLQILALVMAAMFVARPQIMHRPNTDYILIVDCSASMKTANEDGSVRFERAKEEAKEIGKKLFDGHRVSLIAASDAPACALEMSESYDEVQLAIDALRCTYGGCDLDKAFELANRISSETAHPQVVLYTDRDCANVGSENVEVVNLADAEKEKNLSIVSMTAKRTAAGVDFICGVSSVGYEGKATIGLKIDDKLVDAAEVSCTPGGTATVSFSEKIKSFNRAEAFIDGEDGRKEDDSYLLCKKDVRKRRVQIVGESPFFLKTALSFVEGCEVKIVPEIVLSEVSGFDLYIYDGVSPIKLPEDGAILLINADAERFGVALGEERSYEAVIKKEKNYAGPLFEGWDDVETVVSAFTPLDCNAVWQTALVCGEDAVCALREQANGMNAAVISFDLHDSNLPLQAKFLQFVFDLLEYTTPSLIPKNDFSYGETVSFSLQPTARSLSVTGPDEQTRTLGTAGQKAVFRPTSLGVFTASQVFDEENEEKVDFFVHIPEEECLDAQIEELPYFVTPEKTDEARDATNEIAFWLALAMLILLAVEWGVYIYEQF